MSIPVSDRVEEWVLDVSRVSANAFKVSMRETIEGEGGLRIMTGVQTAPMGFNIMGGVYGDIAVRLARSVEVMTAAELVERDEDELEVAGKLGEAVAVLLGGG